jgi:hypothetical protein
VAIGRFSITYGSSTGFGGGFGIFDALKGTFGLRDPAGISMARARDPQNPYVLPRPSLPAVAPTTARAAPPQVSGQGTGVNQTPISQPVPQTFAAVGEQKLEPLVQKGTQTMSLDLGNLLGTLGSSYIQARYGGPRQPQVMAPTIRAQGPRAGIAAQPVGMPAVVAGGLGAAAGEVYDFFTEDQAVQLRDGMRIDPVTGCVIKKQRRKRKRLATVSDIKDLAALKSVLSPADLKTWIATHPS